jgi:DNA-binding beta-propeller fold protein YncE
MRRMVVLGLWGLMTVGQTTVPGGPLVAIRTIDLPEVSGRIDHLAMDLEREHLFVAALGNNSVEVVDARAGARLRQLPGFAEPQGIAVATNAGIVAIANGERGDLSMIDRGDFRRIGDIPIGDDPDNVRYDPAAKRLFVGYGTGAIAAVDVASRRRLGDVKVNGHPESFQLERTGSRIFVNVPTAHQIAVIDRATLKLVGTWPVGDASANYPMALDESNHRLFVGCRTPAVVHVYDTESAKRVASVATVGDADDLFYDSTRKRLYVSGGEGYLDVFHQPDADHLTRIARLPTAAGARTCLFVAEQSRLYVAVPHRGAQKAEIRVFAARD